MQEKRDLVGLSIEPFVQVDHLQEYVLVLGAGVPKIRVFFGLVTDPTPSLDIRVSFLLNNF